MPGMIFIPYFKATLNARSCFSKYFQKRFYYFIQCLLTSLSTPASSSNSEHCFPPIICQGLRFFSFCRVVSFINLLMIYSVSEVSSKCKSI